LFSTKNGLLTAKPLGFVQPGLATLHRVVFNKKWAVDGKPLGFAATDRGSRNEF
jgi:hypothetical protein